MALCLPRRRSATSLATRPSTLSVASITNHSCCTSAGFALNVDMSFLFQERFGGPFSAVGASSKRKPLRRGCKLRRGTLKSLRSPPLYKNGRSSPSPPLRRTGFSAGPILQPPRTTTRQRGWLPYAYVQLPPRLPCRQPCRCAQAHRADRHPAIPPPEGRRPHG